jgi:hypothetical protein
VISVGGGGLKNSHYQQLTSAKEGAPFFKVDALIDR